MKSLQTKMHRQILQVLFLVLMLTSSTGHKCIHLNDSSPNMVVDYKPTITFSFSISDKCPSLGDLRFIVVDVYRNEQFQEFCHFAQEGARCIAPSMPGSCECNDQHPLYLLHKNVTADDKDIKWKITGISRTDKKVFTLTTTVAIRHLPSVEFLQSSVTGADQKTSVALPTVPEHSKLTLRCLWKPGFPSTNAKLVWNGLSLDAVQSTQGNFRQLEYVVDHMPCLQGGVSVSCQASSATRNQSLHLTVLCEHSTVSDNLQSSDSSTMSQTTLSTTEHQSSFAETTVNSVSVSVALAEDDSSQTWNHYTVVFISMGVVCFVIILVLIVFGIILYRKVRSKPPVPAHLNFNEEADFQETFELRQLHMGLRNFPGNRVSAQSSSSDSYATIDHDRTSRSLDVQSESGSDNDPAALHAVATTVARARATPEQLHTKHVAYHSDRKTRFVHNQRECLSKDGRVIFVCRDKRGEFVSDVEGRRFDFDHSGHEHVFDRGRFDPDFDPKRGQIVFENEMSDPNYDFSNERKVGVRIVHHCIPPSDPPDDADTADSDYLHPVASKKNKPTARALPPGEQNLSLEEFKQGTNPGWAGKDTSLQGADDGTCACGTRHLHIPYPIPTVGDTLTHDEQQLAGLLQSESEESPAVMLADPQRAAMFHPGEDESLQGAVGGACACGALHPHSHQTDPVFPDQQQTSVVGRTKFHTNTAPFLREVGSARVGDSAFPEPIVQPMFSYLSTSLDHSAGSLFSFTQSHAGPGSGVEFMGTAPFLTQRGNTTGRLGHFQKDALPQFHHFKTESLPRPDRPKRDSVMSSISQSSTDSDGYLQPGKSIFKQPRKRRVAVTTNKKTAQPNFRAKVEKSLSLGVSLDRRARSHGLSKPPPLKKKSAKLVRKQKDTAVSLQRPGPQFDKAAVSSHMHTPTTAREALSKQTGDNVIRKGKAQRPSEQTKGGYMCMNKKREDASGDDYRNRRQVSIDVHAPFQSASSTAMPLEHEGRVLPLQTDSETVHTGRSEIAIESFDTGAGFDHELESLPVETVVPPNN